MLKKFTRKNALALVFLLAVIQTTNVYAQSCGCDTLLKKTVHILDANSVNKPIRTICLDSGARTVNLSIRNFHGTAANRIIVKNCQGTTIFRMFPGTGYGIDFENCTNFRLTGTGSSDFYGIVVDSSNLGVQLTKFSSDFEVDHVMATHISFAGVMAKTDSSGPRSGFKMKNVSFHDINVFKTRDGEGFYIGNTSWSINGYQHDIDSLELYNNITDSTGSDGIQVGATYSGNARIYNNRVTHPGYNPFAAYQGNGIQLGAGFSGRCYNNYVSDPSGDGIVVTGVGNIYAYNNILINVGDRGIYTGSQTSETGKPFNYFNNTIVMKSTNAAIDFRAGNGRTASVYNNAAVRADTTAATTFLRASGTMLQGGNVARSTVGDFHFVDPSVGNYDILPGSPAINAGVNIDSFGVNQDYAYRPRPVDKYDAGAYEYQAALPLYRVNAGGLEVVDSFINWARDKQAAPCAWLDPASTNYTTGSDQPWTGTNATDAPTQLFSTFRYGAFTGNHVNYNFPVSNGNYEVRLYFAENSVQAAGQRVFDVNSEGSTRMHNVDIYAAAGYRTAYKASFTVAVTDSMLDLDFIGVTGSPLINAIAIVPAATGARFAGPDMLPVSEQLLNTDGIHAYPVPLQQKLYVQKANGQANEKVELKLYNATGALIYQAKHTITGGIMNPVDLAPLRLTSGVYLLQLHSATGTSVIRLLKQ